MADYLLTLRVGNRKLLLFVYSNQLVPLGSDFDFKFFEKGMLHE